MGNCKYCNPKCLICNIEGKKVIFNTETGKCRSCESIINLYNMVHKLEDKFEELIERNK